MRCTLGEVWVIGGRPSVNSIYWAMPVSNGETVEEGVVGTSAEGVLFGSSGPEE